MESCEEQEIKWCKTLSQFLTCCWDSINGSIITENLQGYTSIRIKKPMYCHVMVFCCFWKLPSPFTFSENPLGVLLRHSQINMFWLSHGVHYLAPVLIWGPEAMSWLLLATQRAWRSGVPLALRAPFPPTPALPMSMLMNPFVPVYTQGSQSFHSVDFLGLKSLLLTVPSSKELGMNLLFWLGEEL